MTNRTPLRFIIAGGGTGGHVLPAVSVVRELRQREIEFDSLWIGGHAGIERDAAAQESIGFAAIRTGKLRRYVDLENLRDATNLPRGYFDARKLVRGFGPDVVLSTGGYVSVPTVLASRGRAPILTHEQTTVIGLATRINIWSANRLALSFDETSATFRSHRCTQIVTGNPVRASLFNGDAERGRAGLGFTTGLPVVLVTGGARGASPVNQRVEAILPTLLERTQIIHQTGPASANDDFRRLSAWRASFPVELQSRYVVTEFIRDEIADFYALADLIVSRAGAGTVAEVTALGKAAVMIPLPGTGGDEQVKNAKALAAKSAAVVLIQNEATPARLQREIIRLLDDLDERGRIASNAAQLGRRDAASRLVDELLLLAGSR